MLSLNVINEYMQRVKNWSLDGEAISKDFEFNSFMEAIEFVNSVAEIAEKQEHHPDIIVSYDKVRIKTTTHSEKGLTSKDFELAEEIDKL